MRQPRPPRPENLGVLLAAMVALVALGALLFVFGGREPADAGGAVITPPASATTAAITQTRRPPADHFGNGKHEVLAAVMAGTYRTEGSTLATWPMCSWKMHKAGHLVASGTATGPTTITVEPMYDHVESRGCLEWTRVGEGPR